MSIRHHISDDLIVSYAAGSLAEGWGIAVASHLALCPTCRQRLLVAEGVGGELLESAPDEVPADASWASVRARLSDHDSRPAETPRGPSDGSLPEPLRSYVGGDAGSLRWRALGRGAYQVPIRTGDKDTMVRLLRIPAGKPVPEHSHGGRELTLVLSGSFSDSRGVFGPGDIEDADEEVLHQPLAGAGADCICLAVTDAPLKFSSWIVRAVQPLLGI